MAVKNNYTLCGGIFFLLLLQARKQRTAARKNLEGEQDGLNQGNVFVGLIRTAFPDYIPPKGDSIDTYASDYKSCRLSESESLPFCNPELVDIFDKTVKSSYPAALKRMCEFTQKFIDENNMGSWLVRALIETISLDDSINNELFYINGNSQPVNKDQLIILKEVNLQSFLVGIWHFILTQRKNNKAGLYTFNAWHSKPSTKRGKRRFISEIGKNWDKDIRINIISLNNVQGICDEFDNYDDIPDDKDVLLFLNGKAPELTGNGNVPYILIPKGILPQNGEFAEYLDNAYSKYSKIKTLLYTDAPRDFYSFYICNDISQRVYIKYDTFRIETIHNAAAETLRKCSNFIFQIIG